MTVADVGQIELPPGYLPLRVPIEVNFTQRVAVDVSLRTPDGVALGEPVRLSVHSNAYGKVLFAITLSAAAVLVTLAGRRLWHRFRGQPDRADLDRPDLPTGKHAPQRRAVASRDDEKHRV
ncbi:putative secreted protein [Mycobacterium tuberculosis]|nr:putative secreted protein [Mycobacterium tuberculosis]CKS25242.1 putative secreted protein [Mycobacterium tuberculosis]CKT42271.1 putative secreted protein [Mycobacterium tuberculosis]CKV18902.1 putative secreted protein [Mycobacterium tuberculosis]CKW95816.1 putative secreted protein [Mycobacterium tuberculosis]